MHTLGAALALLATVAVLIWAVSLRRKTSGGRGGVALADVALTLVPIIVWLVLTGQLYELTVGHEEISVKLYAPVISSVPHLQVEPLAIGDKPVTRDQLDKFIAARNQAMFLVLGRHYQTDYFVHDVQNLIDFPHFRFVVLQQDGGEFFGMVDVRELAAYMNRCDNPDANQCQRWDTSSAGRWDLFLTAVFGANAAYFAKLPGFVDAAKAVSVETPIIDVLKKMEDQNVDWLPVTKSDATLIGLANKSAALAGLVLDLSSSTHK